MRSLMRLNHRRPTKALIAGALVVFLFSSTAIAVPIVDGRFDAAEGYSLGRDVSFNVEGSSTVVTGGRLWTHVDASSGDLYLCFVQPLTLVDNTYGETTVGWGHDAPSGKGHELKDLTESDCAQFIFTNAAGQAVLDVTMDYLSRQGQSYNCLGVTGGDGGVALGSAASVLAASTSLDYNFNTLGYALTSDSPATDADYTENPNYAGWLFEVIYELRVAGAAFGDGGFGDVAIPVAHDSPNKIGKNKVYPDIDDIPEPTALCLLALGGIFTALRKRY